MLLLRWCNHPLPGKRPACRRSFVRPHLIPFLIWPFGEMLQSIWLGLNLSPVIQILLIYPLARANEPACSIIIFIAINKRVILVILHWLFFLSQETQVLLILHLARAKESACSIKFSSPFFIFFLLAIKSTPKSKFSPGKSQWVCLLYNSLHQHQRCTRCPSHHLCYSLYFWNVKFLYFYLIHVFLKYCIFVFVYFSCCFEVLQFCICLFFMYLWSVAFWICFFFSPPPPPLSHHPWSLSPPTALPFHYPPKAFGQMLCSIIKLGLLRSVFKLFKLGHLVEFWYLHLCLHLRHHPPLILGHNLRQQLWLSIGQKHSAIRWGNFPFSKNKNSVLFVHLWYITWSNP